MNAKLEDALDIRGWAKWSADGMEIDWSTLVFDEVCPEGYSEVVVSLGEERQKK